MWHALHNLRGIYGLFAGPFAAAAVARARLGDGRRQGGDARQLVGHRIDTGYQPGTRAITSVRLSRRPTVPACRTLRCRSYEDRLSAQQRMMTARALGARCRTQAASPGRDASSPQGDTKLTSTVGRRWAAVGQAVVARRHARPATVRQSSAARPPQCCAVEQDCCPLPRPAGG